jgi:hypothetical protein
MKHYPKPSTTAPVDYTPREKVIDPPLSDISVQRLLDDALLALYREIKNLLLLSAKGKLSPTDARDLRDHSKLLFELREQEKDSLRHLTDDELAAKAKEALSETK